MTSKPLVVVAMSGGVDSSVAAALLVNQGYTVIGMMLRLWSEVGKEGENRCCTPDDVAQARRVAAQLGIPFYVLDARDMFYEDVVQSFLHGYRDGITPNPCLRCNQKVRWGFLLTQALTMGGEKLATGHYARLDCGNDGLPILMRGIDYHKDQSYVLSMLSREQLTHSIFPLGNLTKTEVRQMARDLSLTAAEKPESQDLCFLGNQDYRDFLRQHIPEVQRPGKIVDKENNTLGEHQGLAFYTVGQRKGLGLSSPVPLYVLEKDILNNRLVVGEVSDLGRTEMTINSFVWVSPAYLEPFPAEVKIRYKAPLSPAILYPENNGSLRVKFNQSMRDITPGQIAAVYHEDVVVGGGIISIE